MERIGWKSMSYHRSLLHQIPPHVQLYLMSCTAESIPLANDQLLQVIITALSHQQEQQRWHLKKNGMGYPKS